MPEIPSPAPVTQSDRIVPVDILRGVAVLGILVMNIVSYGQIIGEYTNPMSGGREFRGPMAWVWWVQHLLFEEKWMTVFSMLFGAGLLLMSDRAAASGRRSIAGVYYRRLLVLFIIGLVHAYALWYGDVLVAYALCGLLLYPMRRMRPGWLIGLGLAITMVTLVLSLPHTVPADEGIAVPPAPGDGPDMAVVPPPAPPAPAPPAAPAPSETDIMRGGLSSLHQNARMAMYMQTGIFLVWTLWRSLGLMLVGMGLLRLGVFSAARSARFYGWLAAVGYGLGLPVVAYGATRLIAHRFDQSGVRVFDTYFNYVASIAVAMGHVGVIMLGVKAGAMAWLQRRLAAVGQMALTNYLMQSVICTAVFYGWGLGLFNRFDRAQLMLVVVGVWALQLAWSPWWLSRFRFGPAEWLWRSLTYLKIQPMRRRGEGAGVRE